MTEPDWQPWSESSTAAQLLHSIEHTLRVLSWQFAGDSRVDYPKPIPAPWVEDEDHEVRTFGSDPIPLTDLDDFLGWPPAA